MRKLIYLFLMYSVVMSSCHRHAEQYDIINRAASIVDSLPDSALYILRSIDVSNLSDKKLEAQYSLLHGYAQFHNNTEIDSAALVPAISYYKSDKNPFEYALMQLMLSKIDSNRERSVNAIIRLYDSYNIFKNIGDNYWIGMASRDIACEFNKLRFLKEDLKYSEISLDAFRKTGRQPYLDYAILDLGIAYHNNDSAQGAQKFLKLAIDSAFIHNNQAIITEARQILSRSYFGQNNYTQAIEIYKKNVLRRWNERN